MRSCKLNANKNPISGIIISCLHAFREQTGLSRRYSLATVWIWDEQTQDIPELIRQAGMFMSNVNFSDNENGFHLLNIECLLFNRILSPERELWWHMQHTWLYRYDPPRDYRLLFQREESLRVNVMTARIWDGGQKQQCEPFFASWHSEINLNFRFNTFLTHHYGQRATLDGNCQFFSAAFNGLRALGCKKCFRRLTVQSHRRELLLPKTYGMENCIVNENLLHR